MTRQEAIERLEHLYDQCDSFHIDCETDGCGKCYSAIDMAISALYTTLNADEQKAVIKEILKVNEIEDDTISRKEAIETVNNMMGFAHNSKIVSKECVEYALKTVPNSATKPAWIPCDEKLPKEKGKYLVTIPQVDGNSEFLNICIWTGNEWIPSNRVVAWMPLPIPYIP